MSNAKRTPTPDEIRRLLDTIKALRDANGWTADCANECLQLGLDALEAQRDQLQQAREIIDALNRLRHLSSGSAIIARLDPILEKAAAFKRANPAPAATKENSRD